MRSRRPESSRSDVRTNGQKQPSQLRGPSTRHGLRKQRRAERTRCCCVSPSIKVICTARLVRTLLIRFIIWHVVTRLCCALRRPFIAGSSVVSAFYRLMARRLLCSVARLWSTAELCIRYAKPSL